MECGFILVFFALMVQMIHHKVGIDTHGSFRQWVAAFMVGLALSIWRWVDDPVRYLAADTTPSPSPYSSGAAAGIAGMLTAWVMLGGVAVMFMFDRQLGRFWIYRFLRVFGRGFILMFVILLVVRSYFEARVMAWSLSVW